MPFADKKRRLYREAGDLVFTLEVPASQFDMGDSQFAPTGLYARSKFSLEDRLHNTESALAHRLPTVGQSLKPTTSMEAVIIGAGPSIDGQIDNLKAIKTPIFCIDRMCEWAQTHGIVPDYVVVLDASEDVAEFVKHGPLTAQYLVATQCTEDTFNALQERSCYIYSPIDLDIDESQLEEYWRSHGYPAPYFINAGPSVVHASMALALGLNYRRLHVFGFDCHVGNGLYAGSKERPIDFIKLKVSDRIFHTTMPFIMFADRFISLVQAAQRFKMIDSVQIYGDSLAGYLFQRHIDGSRNGGKRTYSE